MLFSEYYRTMENRIYYENAVGNDRYSVILKREAFLKNLLVNGELLFLNN